MVLKEGIKRAALSLEGHDKGRKRGITVKIEGNGWLRERLTEDYSKMKACQWWK